MKIVDLKIHHVRNISSARLTFHPQYNLFVGANGSGKSSLLEAIYLLGTGYSFRTRENIPLIQHGASELAVFAQLLNHETISINKSATESTIVKINQQICRSSSELARQLPCQIFYQDIFQIIDAGPTTRRSLLDWGLFHVKQSYLKTWKDYRQVLKQRNALLRQKAPPSQFVPWDTLLVALAAELDDMRAQYFIEWSCRFQQILIQLTDIHCDIYYDKGWDKKNTGKALIEILSEQFVSDCHRQYTQSGAHQADIYFVLSTKDKARQLLSRGQQKIILIALKLAQAELLQTPCIYLFDDICSELDKDHIDRLFLYLGQLDSQFFITTINLDQLPSRLAVENAKQFKIEHGIFADVSRETNVG